MVVYSKTFEDIAKILLGRTKPSKREAELFKAVRHLKAHDFGSRLIIAETEGTEASTINVYYDRKNVFCIQEGGTDKIKLYQPGEWEDIILDCYNK